MPHNAIQTIIVGLLIAIVVGGFGFYIKAREQAVAFEMRLTALENQTAASERNRIQIENDNKYEWRKDAQLKNWVNELRVKQDMPLTSWDFSGINLEVAEEDQ